MMKLLILKTILLLSIPIWASGFKFYSKNELKSHVLSKPAPNLPSEFEYTSELWAVDGQPFDAFGKVVVADTNFIVASSAPDSGSNNPSQNRPKVYVFERIYTNASTGASTYHQRSILASTSRFIDDNFGCSVALTPETLFVGADSYKHGLESGTTTGASSGVGAVFVYFKNHAKTFEMLPPENMQILTSPSGAGLFGASLSTMGPHLLLVGAPNPSPTPNTNTGDDTEASGAVYIYKFKPHERSWSFDQPILPLDVSYCNELIASNENRSCSQFGRSLVSSPEFLAVGAVAAGNGVVVVARMSCDAIGPAHFEFPSTQIVLQPLGTVMDPTFGSVLATNNRILLVSGHDSSGSGVVYVYYVFSDDTLSPAVVLKSSIGSTQFGSSLVVQDVARPTFVEDDDSSSSSDDDDGNDDGDDDTSSSSSSSSSNSSAFNSSSLVNSNHSIITTGNSSFASELGNTTRSSLGNASTSATQPSSVGNSTINAIGNSSSSSLLVNTSNSHLSNSSSTESVTPNTITSDSNTSISDSDTNTRNSSEMMASNMMKMLYRGLETSNVITGPVIMDILDIITPIQPDASSNRIVRRTDELYRCDSSESNATSEVSTEAPVIAIGDGSSIYFYACLAANNMCDSESWGSEAPWFDTNTLGDAIGVSSISTLGHLSGIAIGDPSASSYHGNFTGSVYTYPKLLEEALYQLILSRASKSSGSDRDFWTALFPGLSVTLVYALTASIPVMIMMLVVGSFYIRLTNASLASQKFPFAYSKATSTNPTVTAGAAYASAGGKKETTSTQEGPTASTDIDPEARLVVPSPLHANEDSTGNNDDKGQDPAAHTSLSVFDRVSFLMTRLKEPWRTDYEKTAVKETNNEDSNAHSTGLLAKQLQSSPLVLEPLALPSMTRSSMQSPLKQGRRQRQNFSSDSAISNVSQLSGSHASHHSRSSSRTGRSHSHSKANSRVSFSVDAMEDCASEILRDQENIGEGKEREVQRKKETVVTSMNV